MAVIFLLIIAGVIYLYTTRDEKKAEESSKTGSGQGPAPSVATIGDCQGHCSRNWSMGFQRQMQQKCLAICPKLRYSQDLNDLCQSIDDYNSDQGGGDVGVINICGDMKRFFECPFAEEGSY